MKQSIIHFLMIVFLSSNVILSETRFLTEAQYKNRVAQYLKIIDPKNTPSYTDSEKLKSYLQDRVRRADNAMNQKDIMWKQLEIISLTPREVPFLKYYTHNLIETFFPRMVQENLDSYLIFAARKGTRFNEAQKDILKIEASKEFAEQILKIVNNAKL